MKADQQFTAKQLMEAFMYVRRAGWQNAVSIHGYKPSEIAVLYCLHKAEVSGESGMMVSEISKRMNVTPPTVTQLVKGMESANLIERRTDQEDRRVVRIHLSETGRQVVKQSLAARLALFDGLVEYLGEEESARLASSLRKAANYLQEQRESTLQLSIQPKEDEE